MLLLEKGTSKNFSFERFSLSLFAMFCLSHYEINKPDASAGVCCSHKVVAVGFNTLCYDASVGVLNPPHE